MCNHCETFRFTGCAGNVNNSKSECNRPNLPSYKELRKQNLAGKLKCRFHFRKQPGKRSRLKIAVSGTFHRPADFSWSTFATIPSVESILAADVVTSFTFRSPDAKLFAKQQGREIPMLSPRPALTSTFSTDIPHRKSMPKFCRTLYSLPFPSAAAGCVARWKKKNPSKRP